MILVSSTEPKEFHTLGQLSKLPEVYGVDFLWPVKGGLGGIQRKTVADLLSSVSDGRLTEEIQRMHRLDVRAFVVEGTWKATSEGVLLEAPRWTVRQLAGLIWSVQAEEVLFWQTRSSSETVQIVEWLADWSRRERVALRLRPKIQNPWGQRGARDWELFVLQSFPGIGPELAEAILNHFGSIPLAWTVGEKELQQVPGIGPKRARELMRALKGEAGRLLDAHRRK